MKITKTLLLCTLLGAIPMGASLSGCGGGNSGIPISGDSLASLSQLSGNYKGKTASSAISASGIAITGTFTLSISNTGVITGKQDDAPDIVYSGTVDAATGTFSISVTAPDGAGGNRTLATLSGTLRKNGIVITGTGTYQAARTNTYNTDGTVTLTKVL